MEISFLTPTKDRYPDSEAHEPGCMSEEIEQVCSDPIAGYVDLYCSCHRYTEPKVLSNGTDIAWPAGWNQAQALEWRAAHGLIQPGSTSPGEKVTALS